MKILFTTDQIYLHGGVEKVMAEKANYFADVFGFEVTILTTEQRGKLPCYNLSEKVEKVDLAINYERTKSYVHPVNLQKLISHKIRWSKAVRRIDPDILIVCNYAFDFYWVPFFFNDIAKLKEYHSSGFAGDIIRQSVSGLAKIKFIINDFIASKYDQLILLNPDEKKFFKSKNTVIIPNPSEANAKTAILDEKQVIAAGRIAPIKGFEQLIKAWSAVSEYEPGWKLHIYGQGETDYINQLQDKINEYGLQDTIIIKQAVGNLPEVMSAYSLYVMSSHSECFPLVLLESLAVGLPIVSFDCPTGPANIITNGEDGFLIKGREIQQLTDKIVFLIQNPELRKQFGLKAKINSERFSVDKIMNMWLRLFQQLNKRGS